MDAAALDVSVVWSNLMTCDRRTVLCVCVVCVCLVQGALPRPPSAAVDCTRRPPKQGCPILRSQVWELHDYTHLHRESYCVSVQVPDIDGGVFRRGRFSTVDSQYTLNENHRKNSICSSTLQPHFTVLVPKIMAVVQGLIREDEVRWEGGEGGGREKVWSCRTTGCAVQAQ